MRPWVAILLCEVSILLSISPGHELDAALAATAFAFVGGYIFEGDPDA